MPQGKLEDDGFNSQVAALWIEHFDLLDITQASKVGYYSRVAATDVSESTSG